MYMFKLLDSYVLFICLGMITPAALSTDLPIAKPGCVSTCGNVTVPYPFGIGLYGECSRSIDYDVKCDTSVNPPTLLYNQSNIEITDITIMGQMRIRSTSGTRCSIEGEVSDNQGFIRLATSPMVFSDNNKFTVVGCNTLATIEGTRGQAFTSGCVAMCSSASSVINESCTGIGCCQTSIPQGLKNFITNITEMNINEAGVVAFSPCSFAFLAEEDRYTFNGDVGETDNEFYNRTKATVPVLLDWYIDDNNSCVEAGKNEQSYACRRNTTCIDFKSGSYRGYRCSCLPGYQGNPYLSPGCTDIDECAGPIPTNCSNICTNIDGNYTCHCPKGYVGDGYKGGSGCTKRNSQLTMKIGLGVSFGLLFCMIFLGLIHFSAERKKIKKQREKFFVQNGGIQLKQQLSPYEGRNDKKFKIYTSDELRDITNNYSQDRILGKGGYGIVHKGILKDGRVVAVKTSKIVDETQKDQFINELAILTQVNHCNVVKLLGCCLETEVPVLVYEYISNGTLSEHIHRVGGKKWLTWRNCVRLASEAADAFSYLHSAALPPIIHRDVKSSNILIDENYVAKISDFGASRLIPIDETRIITSVLGTFGYIDPEYFQTNQLTEKSDVYSFGVLLAELLTKQPPICSKRKLEEKNLAAYFLMAMKEDRLLEILDPEIVNDANEEHLYDMAKLVKNCLNVKGDDRPTMKEVAISLEALKNRISNSWTEQNNEESTSLLGQVDLYPVMYSSHYDPSPGEASGTYNSLQKDMLIEMNSPR